MARLLSFTGRCCNSFRFAYGRCSTVCSLVGRSGGGSTKGVGYALLSTVNRPGVSYALSRSRVFRTLSFVERGWLTWRCGVGVTVVKCNGVKRVIRRVTGSQNRRVITVVSTSALSLFSSGRFTSTSITVRFAVPSRTVSGCHHT